MNVIEFPDARVAVLRRNFDQSFAHALTREVEAFEDPRLVRIGYYEDGVSGRHDVTKVIEPFIESLLAELQKSENAKYVNWTKVDDFRKFGGIRIEDDLVVTDDGHINLTRQAFAS